MAEYTQNNHDNVEYFNSDGTKKKAKKDKKKGTGFGVVLGVLAIAAVFFFLNFIGVARKKQF